MFLHGMGGPQHSWSARPLEEARLRERSSDSVPHLVSWCESTVIYVPGLKRGLQLSALTDQKALLEQEDPKDHRIPNHSRAVWKQSGWDAAALLGRYKMPTCHAEKAKRSPRCFFFFEGESFWWVSNLSRQLFPQVLGITSCIWSSRSQLCLPHFSICKTWMLLGPP